MTTCWIWMKNESEHPVKIDAAVIEGCAGAGKVTVPPGKLVKVRAQYAVRQFVGGSNPTALPSTVDRLSGGRLQPHGREARELVAEVFHHQLESVVVAQARDAVRDPNGTPSVADPREAQRKLDAEIGARVRASLGIRDAPPTPPVQIFSPEEVGADEP